MNKLSTFDWVALIIIIVGAINWGLVGLFKIDIIKVIFGDMTIFARMLYIIVGLAGLYLLILSFKLGKK
ncbi:MAG: DUF378 domain-containing protein [Candidatus Nealsonbacteria bacterium CG23_combo_of_CG06-09_8_20_14_all_40_13]|uniref:DUF378 domain-containing protein n=1 Tax=Candidatus Nealsonbacteria bacterium CG23_combo_of_CG06-09_8_20_14_all_40_13 TaxID=1974724 RepID=A0A2G9YR23_9BACT|nr:MAG: DUF378 domain-containing protein [Candidatus Nealsonbacteria bacterium CG23_combo_of_CG06-09_8_20_14_all_40_13]PIR71336.1 MAG: DUF378 domain-containing protein [Candidatus Nealsonbacteria bacterium CG10_big_fil_rev_8_21_14_0_10_40_24]PIU43072.1 MAG: DUF378 domain-containing protein [Candidatus Nealsonbacteria bacterium CG07_land_8_20_14_0_80_40_10]